MFGHKKAHSVGRLHAPSRLPLSFLGLFNKFARQVKNPPLKFVLKIVLYNENVQDQMELK